MFHNFYSLALEGNLLTVNSSPRGLQTSAIYHKTGKHLQDLQLGRKKEVRGTGFEAHYTHPPPRVVTEWERVKGAHSRFLKVSLKFGARLFAWVVDHAQFRHRAQGVHVRDVHLVFEAEDLNCSDQLLALDQWEIAERM
jgi:hypothetical protein